MQKLIFLLGLLFLLPAHCFAQETISGTVKDSSGKPISTVTVSLLKTSDSSWVRSAVSGDDGSFSFNDIPKGDYVVDARLIGYIANVVAVKGVSENIVIVLQKNDKTLKEVTVSAKKPLIELSLGKTIINVDGMISTAGNNVLELLKKSPGINVDNNGITMAGKGGAMVLIDDKPTYLSTQDLIEYLKGMSADEVAQLELITQPSAKYDAEGNSGIINIKTKKGKRDGLNGTVTASAGATLARPYEEVSFQSNYKIKKLNLFANASYFNAQGFADWKDVENLKDNNSNITSSYSEHSHPVEEFSTEQIKAGFDYGDPNKTQFGLNQMLSYHPNRNDLPTSSIQRDYVNADTTFGSRMIHEGFYRQNVATNLYVDHQFSKESKLSINADYLYYYKKEHQDITSNTYNAQMIPTADPVLNNTVIPITNNILSLKADYNIILKGVKIESGIKSSYVTVDYNNQYNEHINNTWIPDTTQTNHFIYKENTNAAYVQGNKSFGSNWQAQAGLRAENTNIEGHQLVHDTKFTQSYTSLFPTAFVSYKADSNNQFEVNYGRRIARPGYGMLNPFILYSFEYNYTKGNPYLLPQYTNNFEIKHSYKNKLVTTASYSYTSDVISNILVPDDTTHIIYQTNQNIARTETIHASILYDNNVKKWLDLTLSGYCFFNYNRSSLNNTQINTAGGGYGFSIHSRFNFSKKWAGECNYHYGGPYYPTTSLQITPNPSAIQDVSAGVSGTFWHDTTTIRLSFEDQSGYTQSQNSATYSTNSSFRANTFALSMALTYNFGKQLENKRHRESAPEEAGRMY